MMVFCVYDSAGNMIETKGTGTAAFSAGGVSISFEGQADQHVVVGKGVPGPQPGAGDCSLVVGFSGAAFEEQVGPLTARLAMPTLTVSLKHADDWGYEARLDLPSYGATLRLSDALEQAGLTLPLSLPSIDETRSLSLSVADGRFSAREGATA